MFAVPGSRPGPRLIALLLALSMLSLSAGASDTASFEQALGNLATTNFKQKERAVGELVAARHANTRDVLNAMLEGNLYFRKADKRVFIGTAQDANLMLRDALTLQASSAFNTSRVLA